VRADELCTEDEGSVRIGAVATGDHGRANRLGRTSGRVHSTSAESRSR
jgi:hypothetical protein